MVARKSGIHLEAADIPIVLGMAARNDRNHDIAAWFGVNQGRVAEAKKGEFGLPPIAPANTLPPKGPPGIKGRRLRGEMAAVLASLKKGDAAGAKALVEAAIAQYDANEP